MFGGNNGQKCAFLYRNEKALLAKGKKNYRLGLLMERDFW